MPDGDLQLDQMREAGPPGRAAVCACLLPIGQIDLEIRRLSPLPDTPDEVSALRVQCEVRIIATLRSLAG